MELIFTKINFNYKIAINKMFVRTNTNEYNAIP